MPARFHSLRQPGLSVIVAGFQNMDPRLAEPAATPANAMPSPTVLCSRRAKAPAWAEPWVATVRIMAETAQVRALFRAEFDMVRVSPRRVLRFVHRRLIDGLFQPAVNHSSQHSRQPAIWAQNGLPKGL